LAKADLIGAQRAAHARTPAREYADGSLISSRGR
jgi:hypothetical protein